MTIVVCLKLLLIVFSVFLTVSVVSYFVELRRYVLYLEHKVESYRMKEVEMGKNEKNKAFNEKLIE